MNALNNLFSSLLAPANAQLAQAGQEATQAFYVVAGELLVIILLLFVILIRKA